MYDVYHRRPSKFGLYKQVVCINWWSFGILMMYFIAALQLGPLTVNKYYLVLICEL